MKRIKLIIDGQEVHSWYSMTDLGLSFSVLSATGVAVSDVLRYSELIYTPPWNPGLLVSLACDASWIATLLLIRWAHRYHQRRKWARQVWEIRA